MTVKITNQYKPRFQPTNLAVTILPPGKDRPKAAAFGEDPTASFKHEFKPAQPNDNFSEFVVFVPLLPGRYELTELTGTSLSFPIVGSFVIPVQFTFTLPPNRVLYLGRVEAVNRERRNDQEPRSGPVFPLLDQSVSGFSGGTFDLQTGDNAGADIAMLKAGIPTLGGQTVEKAVLSISRK